MEGSAVVDAQALHAASEVREVPLDSLRVDKSYQRDPTQSLVDKMVEDGYDVVSAELLLISDRGERDDGTGGLYIVNGQHRSLAARKIGLTHILARVIDLHDAEDPAAVEAVFRLKTNVRMSDKPLERFKAQVRAGDPQSIEIVALLEKFGTEVNEVPQSDVGINAISTVERLYALDQGSLLSETLQVIKEAFGAVGGRPASASMLQAVSWFILKHSDETDRQRFVDKLRENQLEAIERRGRSIGATMSGPLWLNYYRAFVHFYNERLHDKSKLEWKHGGSSSWKGSTDKWGSGRSSRGN